MLPSSGLVVKQLAQDVCNGLCSNNPTGLPQVQAGDSQVQIILQLAFGIIGVIALVMIILAGFQLSVSLGNNPEAITKARKTLIYAVVGLIIAVSAELIVSFALNKL
jgi:heme/copper-type cytochrome/quinol oxidase subunit 2